MSQSISYSIAVLGAGQMGSGIAQVGAASGFDIVLYDLVPGALTKATATISASCDRLIKKEVINMAKKEAILGHIKTTAEFGDLKNCDIAIEAVTENETLKLEIFKKLDGILKPGAILASNTSSNLRVSFS